MENKKFQMNLLNAEEMQHVQGGNTVSGKPCTKAGDTILHACFPIVGDITIVWCTTYEAHCTVVFTPCTSGGDTSICTEVFTLTPK